MGAPAAAIVQELFERLNSGGIEPTLELIAPDAVFVVPPEASAEPDIYEGHEGARRYFEGFEGVLDDVRFELRQPEEVAPGAVLAQIRLSGRGAATGIPVAQAIFGVLTVRDGLVDGITIYGERAAALAGARAGRR